MIQRLIRFQNAVPHTQESTGTWLTTFTILHHTDHDHTWKKHYIHLDSFGEIRDRFVDEEDEASIVHWNRNCILEYLSAIVRNNNSDSKPAKSMDIELTYGIETILQGNDITFSLDQLFKDKKETIYKAKINYLLDDDALGKIPILIRLYTEGVLNKWRNPKRDVLKFISFTLNEKKSQQAVSKCYLDRLDSLPLHVIEEIFKHLEAVLAHRGRIILTEFARVNLARESPSSLAKWFMAVVIDDIEDVAKAISTDAALLTQFLKGNDKALRDYQPLKNYLRNIQQTVQSGATLYEYHIWVEPIKVTPVVLEKSYIALESTTT